MRFIKLGFLTPVLALLLLLSLSCKSNTAAEVSMSSADKLILTKVLQEALEQGLNQQESGLRIRAIASSFLGSPYVAGSLEAAGEERLQINLRAFDCLTLVENVLAINEAIMGSNEIDSCIQLFPLVLQNIRYRNGILQSYTSRLHYTSEWLLNGQEKGLIRIRSDLFLGQPFPLDLNYMSSHPENYPALKAQPELIDEIARIEAGINKAQLSYIPKDKLYKYVDDIPEGSIIAITTNIKGLDIAHIGFAYWKNHRLHLLHASSSLSQVVVTDQDLLSYLNEVNHFTGIMIAKANN